MGGMVFFEVSTILVVFIKQINSSPIAIGLIPFLMAIGYNIPGFFSTIYAKRFKQRKQFIMITALIQRLSLLLLVLSTFFINLLHPIVAVTFVLFSFFLFCFSGGIGIPAWLDMVAKTIPVTYRARTFALRIFFASIAGIFFPIFISFILLKNTFPGNYRISFFLGFIFIFLSYVSLLFIKEERDSPIHEKQALKVYFLSLFRIIKDNPNFKRFIITRLVFSVTSWGTAFYTAYALDTIPSVTEYTVALYTLFLNISKGGSSLIFGYLGDRYGNLLVQQLSAAFSTCALILAVLFPSYSVFFIIFIFFGMIVSANLNAGQVLITEFGDDKDRIIFTTISSALIGMAAGFIPLIGGFLLSFKVIGYKGLFTISAFFGAASFLLYLFYVKDPRHDNVKIK